jgi:hypothetical protein
VVIEPTIGLHGFPYVIVHVATVIAAAVTDMPASEAVLYPSSLLVKTPVRGQKPRFRICTQPFPPGCSERVSGNSIRNAVSPICHASCSIASLDQGNTHHTCATTTYTISRSDTGLRALPLLLISSQLLEPKDRVLHVRSAWTLFTFFLIALLHCILRKLRVGIASGYSCMSHWRRCHTCV